MACNSYNRATVAASAEIRFRRPTQLGDRLVATATELTREGPDGVYDVLVTVGDVVVAVFVGRSKEIGGTLFPVDGEPQRSSRASTSTSGVHVRRPSVAAASSGVPAERYAG